MRLCGAQMYRDNYGNHKQFTELRQRCAELARENAELKDKLNKVSWNYEQAKLLLASVRNHKNCVQADDCVVCLVHFEMYAELLG